MINCHVYDVMCIFLHICTYVDYHKYFHKCMPSIWNISYLKVHDQCAAEMMRLQLGTTILWHNKYIHTYISCCACRFAYRCTVDHWPWQSSALSECPSSFPIFFFLFKLFLLMPLLYNPQFESVHFSLYGFISEPT